MIQRCTNHPSHSESFNVVQIFQRCIIPWLYKSFEVVQILQRSKKSFNVVQIIQRSTNLSTLYKSLLNAVQIFQIFLRISLLSTILSNSNLEEV